MSDGIVTQLGMMGGAFGGLSYVSDVETADGESLESAVADAFSEFLAGLESDDLLARVHTAYILMGARTLDGIRVPIKGEVAENNGFVLSDYDRSAGLAGDGSSYLNSLAKTTADIDRDDNHLILNVSVGEPLDNRLLAGAIDTSISNVSAFHLASNPRARNFCLTPFDPSDTRPVSGFMAVSRQNSGVFHYLYPSGAGSRTTASRPMSSLDIFIFSDNLDGSPRPCSPTINYFSTGAGYSPAELLAYRARIQALESAIAAALTP